MKLIIDILDEEYNRIKEWEDNITGYQTSLALYRAVRDGTPYEERPQGEWKYRKEWFENEPEERMAWGCSSCGFSIQNNHDKQNYCPYCGAYMREAENETDK